MSMSEWNCQNSHWKLSPNRILSNRNCAVFICARYSKHNQEQYLVYVINIRQSWLPGNVCFSVFASVIISNHFSDNIQASSQITKLVCFFSALCPGLHVYGLRSLHWSSLLFQGVMFSTYLVIGPTHAAVVLGLIYRTVGNSALAGAAFMVLFIAFIIIVGFGIGKLRWRFLNCRSVRSSIDTLRSKQKGRHFDILNASLYFDCCFFDLCSFE